MSEIGENFEEIDEGIQSEENEIKKDDGTKAIFRRISRKSKALDSRKSTLVKNEPIKNSSAKPSSKKQTLPDTIGQDFETLSASKEAFEKSETLDQDLVNMEKSSPDVGKSVKPKQDFVKLEKEKKDFESLDKPKRNSVKVEKQKKEFEKLDKTSRDSEKSEKPKKGSVKSDSLKQDSEKPETPKAGSIKELIDTPKSGSVKPGSSKPESEDFEDDKRTEYLGEADVDRLPFDKEKFFFFPDKGEYPSIWGEDESSDVSTASVGALVSEVEETEEERELRKERETLIDSLRQKLFDRMLLRRRNTYLNKKLVEHFKKRRMENVLKEEPKGLDLESKYLRSLHAFKEFKQIQEKEINDLTYTMEKYEDQIKQLQADLDENLKNSAARAKEVSLNLILTKTGKKINEKTVDRLLRRQIQKSEEKGKEKLKYIKIKNLIEEKELQLKAMEYFGEGLHIAVYEQMKIDNQNYSDKIEEKEDELTKLRLKTQTMIQNLAHIKEKIYAVEGDIELMEEKVFDVEKTFVETRERLTAARIKRDNLRLLFRRYKNASGLLTRTELLRDFEESISKAKNLSAYLQRLKKSILEKNRQENKLAKILSNANAAVSDNFLPIKIKIRSKTSNQLREVYVADKALKNSVDLMVRKT